MPRDVPLTPLEHGLVIDRGSPVPLYFQVAQQLEQAIKDGRLRPGTRMANEIEFAAQLAVSRPTMRRAMEYLVDKGLVVRQRGVGTRVVSAEVRRSLELTSLHDDLAASGQQPHTSVLSLEIVGAPDTVAEVLGIAVGDPVTEILRLRSARSQPLAHLTNYLPADRFTPTREALEGSGLYALLRLAGVHLHSATQVIGARIATTAEARLFGERRGAPLLTMQRTAYDDRGIVVEYGNHFYAASHYSFQMSLLST